MRTFNQIIDSNGKILVNNFPDRLKFILEKNDSEFGLIDFTLEDKKVKGRLGAEYTSHGKVIVFSYEEKYVKSTKLFKDFCKMNTEVLDNIVVFKNEISLSQNEYVQELIHNLTSLNTYNIQELFSLIPQHILTQNINKQKEVIKTLIVEKPNITTTTLLNLIKYNYAMKVEFSVFEKTVMQNPTVQKLEYSVRENILSILQIFIEDFEKQKINVSIDSNDKRLYLDYDIFFVSLFYIFENAVKYCATNSDFKIIFKEEQNVFKIVFDMVSISIEDDEISKLCQKKFRSKSAMLLTDKGNGIGMNRIVKTLRLNSAKLEIFPRVSAFTKVKQGIVFEHNQFVIIFDSNRLI